MNNMYQILSYKKLNSTNKFALENISSLPDNSVISADIQDAGRGRFDRKWISDKPNNCYISFRRFASDTRIKDAF